MSNAAPHVMLVNGSLDGGGAEHVVATLALHLRELNHRVTIGVVRDGGEVLEELREAGFPVVVTSDSYRSSVSNLLRSVEELGVQLVHSHDLRMLIDASVCRLRARRIAHMHTFHFGNYPHLPWKRLLIERVAARLPDTLVAVGNVQRASIVSALGLREARLRTIWNGVDYHPDPDWTGADTADGVVRVGSISTFGEQKGLPTLLRSAKILRDGGAKFRLILVGEGPLRPSLEASAAALGIADCVEFTGWRPDAARTLLPTFDIFVQSSYWEAMSVVILEAMAAKKPIVATSVGENTAVLESGQAAILVPPRDAAALADGLGRLIADPSLRASLGQAAHKACLRSFTGRGMAERYAAAYRGCLEARGSVSALQ